MKIVKNKKVTVILRIYTAPAITSGHRDLIFWIFQFLTKPSKCTKWHKNLRRSLPFSSKSVSLQLDWT